MPTNLIISRTINYLRFPLAVLVVSIHYDPIFFYGSTALDEKFFNIFSYTVAYIIGDVAVPVFFFISGYLFFCKVCDFNHTIYRNKLHSRLKSLVLPYFLWNILTVIVNILAIYLACLIGADSYETLRTYTDINLNLNMFWGSKTIYSPPSFFGMINQYAVFPALSTFWYVRNLIILVILSPVIYTTIKKAKIGKVVLAILLICYVTGLWIPYSPFNITGFMFFTLGAYFGLHKLDFTEVLGANKRIIYATAIILLTATILIYIYGITVLLWTATSSFIFFGVLTTLCWGASAVRKSEHTLFERLSVYSFFIFASHLILICKASKIVVQKIASFVSFSHSGVIETLCFISSTALTVFICIMLFWVLKRLMPRVLALLTGDRD